MATVSDSSIMSMAQDIVTDFVDGKTSLNEGVMKKSSENGFNADQTQRLIERTNTEAFLRKFPEETEFEVASPEVVLGSMPTLKTASISVYQKDTTSEEGLFKAASVSKKPEKITKYQEKIAAITGEDIFGMEDTKLEVLPSTIDAETRQYNECLAQMQKSASQERVEKFERENKFNEKVEEIAEYIKQASLSGTQSINDSELELLNMFPDNSNGIRLMYDSIVEKMASEYVQPEKLARSTEIPPTKLAHETELTKKFEELLEIAK